MPIPTTKGNSKKPITINGGGIAGLTTALCLAEEGFVVEIHEKAKAFEEVGAGIQISPNAYQVFEKLKVGRQVRKAGTVPDSISVRKARNGREIARVPLGLSALKRFGYPYVVIHRADLQDILYQKCVESPLIRMHFNSELVDFAVHDNGITTAIFQESGIYEDKASCVILADGVHSKLRTRIMDLPPPEFKEKIAWRALVRGEQVPKEIALDNTMVWFGPKAHFVTYPVRDGKFLNVVAIIEANSAKEAKENNKEKIASHFRKWAPEIRALFETNARWTGWPLYQSSALEKMSEGPVTMVGDASHAMLPFAAQGAAMAIEDAALLAQYCSAHKDFETAFANFEQERVPRVREVMQLAELNGKIYHLGWPSSVARNLVMRFSKPEKLLARQDWIYKWRS